MNIKFIDLITYIVIATNYIDYADGINSRTNKPPILRCNSAPDLRLLFNTTSYIRTFNDNNNIISSSEYKTVIFNKYKRNIYLRSKEKYTFEDNR
jgi:uncharacterized membrane protein